TRSRTLGANTSQARRLSKFDLLFSLIANELGDWNVRLCSLCARLGQTEPQLKLDGRRPGGGFTRSGGADIPRNLPPLKKEGEMDDREATHDLFGHPVDGWYCRLTEEAFQEDAEA